ncbi:M20/M25/M40 family metallo-hydrolase [Campylobacter sp.]|uniref:M20/M25/M40 family metallo-hydrolase n=1 Tax=Campylobacter sp. TaxID=205 RepID=UPI002A54EE09|nr:M20/M25/M40 family metallo-hydrolase [Campylobacter sp.]MDD7091222.1 M20/M25/M40 family metallo-hydrolase [Campylobacteraceae bacterium]MDY5285570.1 M20/M25/M40 family metallo-hydrolase [Campylobacter sp.]
MRFLGYFEQICSIPHCSYQAQKLGEFLLEFSKSRGFEAKIDESFNIHAIKGKPKICLQAHYDMVCVGEAPKIELENDGEFLSAKNSTLGADNGIGLAIIMDIMDEVQDLEVLFTSDEEVGLIGANAFAGEICAPALLNLDSEDDNEVIIGCAGGLLAEFRREFEPCELGLGELFSSSVSEHFGTGLLFNEGSHSTSAENSTQNNSNLNADYCESSGHLSTGLLFNESSHSTSAKNSTQNSSNLNANYYELSCEGLEGGHSGMQIAKNIPNAIKELAHFAKNHGANILAMSGGDRDNAIPTWAKALVSASSKLQSKGLVKAKKLDLLGAKELFAKLCDDDLKNTIIMKANSADFTKNSKIPMKANSADFARNSRIPMKANSLNDFLLALPHGVLGWDEGLGLPKTSANLAIVRTRLTSKDENARIAFSVQIYARSSSQDELTKLKNSYEAISELAGFQSSFGPSSMPWEPEQSHFATSVLNALQKYRPNAKITAIHAGLECGCLSAKMKQKGKKLVACSIGPNISGAHTINERCEIKSAKIIAQVVRDLLKNSQGA